MWYLLRCRPFWLQFVLVEALLQHPAQPGHALHSVEQCRVLGRVFIALNDNKSSCQSDKHPVYMCVFLQAIKRNRGETRVLFLSCSMFRNTEQDVVILNCRVTPSGQIDSGFINSSGAAIIILNHLNQRKTFRQSDASYTTAES